MPKIKPSYPSKVKAVVKKHASEFKSAPSSELHCKLCDCIERCEKKFTVESHHHSVKHQNGLKRAETSTTQTFIKQPVPNFAEKVTKAFLSADIPLHMLRNTHKHYFVKWVILRLLNLRADQMYKSWLNKNC